MFESSRSCSVTTRPETGSESSSWTRSTCSRSRRSTPCSRPSRSRPPTSSGSSPRPSVSRFRRPSSRAASSLSFGRSERSSSAVVCARSRPPRASRSRRRPRLRLPARRRAACATRCRCSISCGPLLRTRSMIPRWRRCSVCRRWRPQPDSWTPSLRGASPRVCHCSTRSSPQARMPRCCIEKSAVFSARSCTSRSALTSIPRSRMLIGPCSSRLPRPTVSTR